MPGGFGRLSGARVVCTGGQSLGVLCPRDHLGCGVKAGPVLGGGQPLGSPAPQAPLAGLLWLELEQGDQRGLPAHLAEALGLVNGFSSL